MGFCFVKGPAASKSTAIARENVSIFLFPVTKTERFRMF